MNPKLRIALAAAGLALPLLAGAQAEAWPARPIRIIAPTSPGSSTDYLARALGQYVAGATKQAVVVENKPGGNAVIGVEAARTAPPDGYTWFIGSVSTHSANPALFAKLPYDPARDFVEVGMFSVFPYFAVVRKDSALQTVAQLLEAAKAKPGKLTCGYATAASRVPCELLKIRAHVDILTVPYKAAPAVLNDVAGGVIDFTMMDAMSASIAIKGGLLRPIGITAAARATAYPDVHTVAEALPGFVYEGWAGLSAPAGTPVAVLERMNQYLREALAQPAMRREIEASGAVVKATTLAEQASWTAGDRKQWREWVKLANIPPVE
ncbi:MAG: tripartite tricarboxylate transporter substrate-binding protein [Rubrivivax sp.]